MTRILFTSFETWMPHQQSNASDDLLSAVLERDRFPKQHYLRKIPVDFELAPRIAIAKIAELQPDITICCGMAEMRQRLSIESNGKFQREVLRSRFNLEKLIDGTIATEISHDAGDFVCNHLYYSVLKYFDIHQRDQHCLFVHVPILTAQNLSGVVDDFSIIVDRTVQAVIQIRI